MARLKSILIAGLLAAALGCDAVVHAQEPEGDIARARELFTYGSRLYDEAQYKKAASVWEEAYALSERPELLFNLGDVYERMGMLEQAIHYLDQYRGYADPVEQDVLTRRILSLERRLLEQQRTSEPQPEPTPATPATRGPAPLILAGVGASSLAVGGVSAWMASNARGQLDEHCGEADGTWVCSAQGKQAARRDRSWSLAADIGLVTGLAACSTAGLLALVSTGDRLRWSPRWTQQHVGLQVSGRFR